MDDQNPFLSPPASKCSIIFIPLIVMAIVLASFIVALLSIASSTPPTMAGPRTDLLAKICGDTVVQDEPKYVRSYAKVLQSIQEFMPNNKFATGEDGEKPNRIYVLAQCMDDLSGDDCDVCFSKISSRLVACFPFTAGRVFLDGCFMRFDNYSFFQETTSKSYDIQKCSQSDFDSKEYKESATTLIDNLLKTAKEYRASATMLIDDLVKTAPTNEGYAEGKVTTSTDLSIYGMATCWNTLDTQLCAKCLAAAKAAASACLPSHEGCALNTGCFLRYSTHMFANSNTGVTNPGSMFLYLLYLLGAASCFLAIFLVGVFVGKIIYKKRQSRHDETKAVEMESLVTTSLRFKYSTLQKATENFSESHKIGQGGYGEVFKGTLADGREIAIKRLFISGNHQMEAVCNEMDIICQAQHQNLVRFLGCCFANYSLLVYEFLPNGSLDLILFDPVKKKELNWKRRLGIIIGTAQGLEYLHKDCQVRIVHRDIKASNILLDLKYRPKISDFGLARFYSNDKIDPSTAIAGTLGYMAPEYLAQGRLTEKVDVYSYGVLVLEIVSGVQNNNYHSEDTLNTLVTSTWNHFQAKTVAEIIDRSMEVEDVNEVVRIVQIGLLCTQESPYLRPTMTTLVQMLRQKNLPLCTPSKPPFADEFLTINPDSLSRHQHFSISAVDSCKFFEVDDNNLR